MSARKKRAPERSIVAYDTTLEGKKLTLYVFRGRRCVVASDLGKLLGYGKEGKQLVEVLQKRWASKLVAGVDFDVLQGDDLRDFKALARLTEQNSVSRGASRRLTESDSVSAQAKSLTILYSGGLALVCAKSEKPAAWPLLRVLLEQVVPQLEEPAPAHAPAALPPPEPSRPAHPPMPLPRPRRQVLEAPAPELPVAPPPAVPALPPAPTAEPSPEPSKALAVRKRPSGPDARLERALRLLAPTVDARIPEALRIVSQRLGPYSVEKYLELAAALQEVLPALPGGFPLRPAEKRIEVAEQHLALIEPELAAASSSASPPPYIAITALDGALTMAGRHLKLAIPQHLSPDLRARWDAAAQRLGAAMQTFSTLIETGRPQPPSPAAPPAPAGGAAATCVPQQPPRRRGRPPRTGSHTRRLPAGPRAPLALPQHAGDGQ